MARWVEAFNDTFARLKGDVNKEIAMWTLSCAPARLSRVTSLVVELDDLATSMAVHVTAVEERANHKYKTERNLAREEQAERARLIAPCSVRRFPQGTRA